MALIKCPECKKKVSDQCENCPSCGYPIKANIEKKNAEVPEATTASEVINSAEKKAAKAKKPINKKVLIAIIPVVSVVLIVGGIVGYNALLPRINATRDFKAAIAIVEEKNAQLDAAIKESEDLILKKQPLLDESLTPALEMAISDAKAVKESNFKTPGSVEEIITRTEELKKTDYTAALKNLSEKHEAVVVNAKRYQLVNHPTEAYIIQCLKTIPEIVNISAVTEDNDPNGNLNKPGGYTATVYFAHEKINLDKSIYGETLIEQGTDAGGGIEVYTCVEDAVKRRDYLATFDGGIFANGTHTVIGTVLVRTSNELTATQQKDLEAKLIAALTYLPEIDNNAESSKPDDSTSNQSTTPPTSNSTETEDKKENNTPVTTQPVNKNQEAVKSAEEIADFYATVYPYMVKNLLVSDYGYSESQALYAITNANIDWNYYAVIHLEEYVGMNTGNVTKEDAERHLGADKGYSDSAIQYAFANADIDWRSNEDKNSDKTPTNTSAVGTYIGHSSECTFSLTLYDDGTVIHRNETIDLLIYHGTWSQQGSTISFALQFQDFEEIEYYSSTLYTTGMQFMDFFYTKS